MSRLFEFQVRVHLPRPWRTKSEKSVTMEREAQKSMSSCTQLIRQAGHHEDDSTKML